MSCYINFNELSYKYMYMLIRWAYIYKTNNSWYI